MNKIFRKIGFTETEGKIVLFLLVTFLIGATIRLIKESTNNSDLLKFDYTKEDNLFYQGSAENEDSVDKITGKTFDSKRELLDFTGAKYAGKKLISPAEIIDINKASAEKLSLLPGIGPKIAAAIVEFRLRNGKFKSIEDLKKVKGIGKAKFEKVKNNIIAE